MGVGTRNVRLQSPAVAGEHRLGRWPVESPPPLAFGASWGQWPQLPSLCMGAGAVRSQHMWVVTSCLQGPLGSSPAARAWLGVPDLCGLRLGDFSKVGGMGEQRWGLPASS